jgi:hypothetical protein
MHLLSKRGCLPAHNSVQIELVENQDSGRFLRLKILLSFDLRSRAAKTLWFPLAFEISDALLLFVESSRSAKDGLDRLGGNRCVPNG